MRLKFAANATGDDPQTTVPAIYPQRAQSAQEKAADPVFFARGVCTRYPQFIHIIKSFIIRYLYDWTDYLSMAGTPV